MRGLLGLLSLWGNACKQRPWHVLSTFTFLQQQKTSVCGSTETLRRWESITVSSLHAYEVIMDRSGHSYIHTRSGKQVRLSCSTNSMKILSRVESRRDGKCALFFSFSLTTEGKCIRLFLGLLCFIRIHTVFIHRFSLGCPCQRGTVLCLSSASSMGNLYHAVTSVQILGKPS